MKRVQLVRIDSSDSVSNPLDSLYTGNPLTGTLAKSEDPDEMHAPGIILAQSDDGP